MSLSEQFASFDLLLNLWAEKLIPLSGFGYQKNGSGGWFRKGA